MNMTEFVSGPFDTLVSFYRFEKDDYVPYVQVDVAVICKGLPYLVAVVDLPEEGLEIWEMEEQMSGQAYLSTYGFVIRTVMPDGREMALPAATICLHWAESGVKFGYTICEFGSIITPNQYAKHVFRQLLQGVAPLDLGNLVRSEAEDDEEEEESDQDLDQEQ